MFPIHCPIRQRTLWPQLVHLGRPAVFLKQDFELDELTMHYVWVTMVDLFVVSDPFEGLELLSLELLRQAVV